MTLAIKVENLGKKYTIGHQRKDRYETLRDKIAHAGRSAYQRLRHPLSINREEVEEEEFWALRDISFEIRQGERVGIIGRNGAGKSTLLKILSRITQPTTGKATINGRVSSLLEVGTGFHPELSGRENIFLNGAILGMRKAEIEKKFDEIVAFAEVEKFLDTPVKRYSSGMYVRLAFAIAAHLEPEILIVDEVLAVGDVQFQNKCLAKMDQVGKEGRTVVFVSHNMGVITKLCPKSIWLEKGELNQIGNTNTLTDAYLCSGLSELRGEKILPDDISKHVQLKKISLINHQGEIGQSFDCDKPIAIKFDLMIRKPVKGLYGYIGINKPDGTPVMVSDSFDGSSDNPLDNLPVGISHFEVIIPPRSLGHGEYLIHFSFASQSADNFHVDIPGVVSGFSLFDFSTKRGNRREGYFSTLLSWRNCDQKATAV
ncbi:MAG: ABC transporter ATP-binding protein [Gammaproteobacteria bacterium]